MSDPGRAYSTALRRLAETLFRGHEVTEVAQDLQAKGTANHFAALIAKALRERR